MDDSGVSSAPCQRKGVSTTTTSKGSVISCTVHSSRYIIGAEGTECKLALGEGYHDVEPPSESSAVISNIQVVSFAMHSEGSKAAHTMKNRHREQRLLRV